MADLKETPSQTAGPYVHIGLATEAAGFSAFAPFGSDIAGPNTVGERIRVEGMILDGDGTPMPDALLEVWQMDANGAPASADPNDSFTGFGRVVPDFETGQFSFETIKPGGTDGAPHLQLWLVARGINLGLHTRMYFADEFDANAADPVLAKIDPTRRATLIAAKENDAYRFVIRLQGDKETVFFDV